ncbi:MAG TPA: FAD:protein FMN transferase [Gammaproteobacteria bacterium]
MSAFDPSTSGARAAFAFAALACAATALDGCAPRRAVDGFTGFAQGTTYSVQWPRAAGVDEAALEAAVRAELERIDALLSNYRPDSAVERFNAARSTEPFAAPPELVELLEQARAVHDASAGCFDPTVRPLVGLWGFDGDAPHVPAPDALAAARRRVDLAAVERVDAGHLRKRIPDVEVDVSGIAQGYSAGRLARVLEERGLGDYLVEIGGELLARGHRPDGSGWRVAVEAPTPDGTTIARVLTLPAEPTAVATSGSYRHFFTADGRRYSHVLDPRTGAPVDHDLVSVTVLHRDPALADAWSTALLCLGPGAAQEAAARAGVAALLFTAAGESLREWVSPAFAARWPGTP